MILAGLALFVVASLLCGVTTAPWQLFAARALQGIGAALVSPNALSALLRVFDDEKSRGRALGLWASVASAGAIAGQLLGGVLTDLAGWRSIFLINVPVGVVALLGLRRALPALPGSGAGRPALPNALLLVTVVGGGSLVLAAANGGWSSGLTAVVVVLVVLAVALVVAESRSRRPLLEPGLLRQRGVVVGNTVLALNVATVTTALYVTSLVLQNELGFSAMQTGLAFAPITAIVLLVSPKAGAAVATVGARPLLVGAGIATTAGVALLTAFAERGYLVGVLPGLALVALGSGLGYAPMFALATGVDDRLKGAASGLVTTVQELGAAVGLAALTSLGLVLATSAQNGTTTYLVAALASLLATLVALAAGPARETDPISEPEREPAT
ncbi:MFS transporter [Cryptosporangium aurantiacum]|uniref:Major Facilitator Superfamily protein n=1 Tax=Cryptosporangium aurantiacum TaxID=134849 RepID=A0A1M7TVK4_9ACTN|nr:MFS transporter [Cryptosporangium aurantiacum]SHN74751.1 Major Facilitator Superfamily protein [Cryptosporangium aurantiacum]